MDYIKTNLIIDTDIGEDIDDTWALVFLLSSQFVDIKLISVSTGDVNYKASLVAKILSLLHMTHIPICLGKSSSLEEYSQKEWLNDFDISSYDGVIYKNYEESYRKVIDESQNITILELAPMSTLVDIKNLLDKPRVKVVAMAGSIYHGYFKSKEPSIECNIVRDIEAAKIIFNSKINLTLVPLDVCGDFIVSGDDYQKILNSKNIRSHIVIENYQIWSKKYQGNANKFDPKQSSSILYDLLASFVLLFPQYFDYLHLPITVTDDGYTLVSGSNMVNVAIKRHKTDAMFLTLVERSNTDIETNKRILKLSVEGMYSLTYALQTSNPTLFVTEVGWEQRHAGSSFGPLERDYYILHVVEKGKGVLDVDGKKAPFKEGDIFLVPPHTKVAYSADENDPCKYYWVAYSGLMANELTVKIGLTAGNNYVISPIKFSNVLQKIKEMNEIAINVSGVEYKLLGHLYILFSELFNENESLLGQEKDHVHKAIEYLQIHYQEELRINDLAKTLLLDRTYLYRLFKQQTGLSIKEYLINLRMEKAKVLIANTNQSLREISILVGYSSYLSFSNTFKDKVRMTPNSFRKAQKQQK
jgi:inosine-uridine nucleoside N-ribohydrolase/AraC-like DNA-binding protein